MNSERAEFLRAIKEAPDDDAPRLMFADWLDEHGEPERAEFIRIQCELDVRIQCELDAGGPFIARAGDYKKSQALMDREKVLLLSNVDKWTKNLPRNIQSVFIVRGEVISFWQSNLEKDVSYHFKRGFVHEVAIDWSDWVAHSATILAEEPVQKVFLVTIPWIVRIGDGREFVLTNQDSSMQISESEESSILNQLKIKWPNIDFTLRMVYSPIR